MQCVSCGFFNVPGSAACGRCGTTLRFEQLAVATLPPRAPKHGRWLRHVRLGWLAHARDITSDVRTTTARDARTLLGEDVPPMALFQRMIVPGWALRRAGAVTAGWAALAAWGVCITLALLFLGWQICGLFLGLAFNIHYVSGLAACRIAGFDRVYTARVGILIALMLLVTVYAPATLAFNAAFQPVTVNRITGPFHAEDVIVYSRLSSAASGGAKPGQWISFEIREQFGFRPNPSSPQVAYVQAGEYLAQVIGRPGDKLAWDGKVLTVNGEPALWQPSLARQGGKPSTATVPEGRYLVAPWIPDVIGYNNPNYQGAGVGAGALNLADESLYVSFSRVNGRVFVKLHPLTQMSWVK